MCQTVPCCLADCRSHQTGETDRARSDAAPDPNAAPAALNTRTPLAKADFVSLFTGQPVRTVFQRAAGGSAPGTALQWVFNVATNPRGKIRSLRFWVPEFAQSPQPKVQSLEAVIKLILPVSRREFPADEVQAILQVRHNTLLQLRRELNGQVRKHKTFYPRAGLVTFFRSRWLGAADNA